MADHSTQPTGRVFDAAIDLLDQQLVDSEGHLAGKVDDLELSLPDPPASEGGSDELPEVTALLSGPGALAERFAGGSARGGRAARAWAELHRRLHPSQPGGPAKVSLGLVKRIGNRIELSVPREELPLNLFEEWFRDHVIEKLPGARHAAE